MRVICPKCGVEANYELTDNGYSSSFDVFEMAVRCPEQRSGSVDCKILTRAVSDDYKEHFQEQR